MRRAAYSERRRLRRMERWWGRLERLFTWAASSRFNPLYHLGTLAVFLLFVLLATGIYLTIFYRPGMERAHATVLGISQTSLGLLVRSVHRYAADALVVVILLHALKMLLSDRFWGSRWVAWVTGWGLFALVWIIGVMGYWLIWDRRAQWLTEYFAQVFGPSFAMTFMGPDAMSRSFAFFVIVLFLHVFLGVLIFLGFLLHILRLTRPRWLAPRWLMVETALVLLLLSLLRPADLLERADFGRLLTNVPVDWLYLGFLPLTARWGNTLFWGFATALLALAVASPWLAPGRSAGPARVTEHLCTGCALCALKCPYEAVEILPRSDESGFKSLALINPNLCVGCGLCIGTCAATGIDLDAVPTQALLDEMANALEGASQPVLLFTCQRHAALGTLPSSLVPAQVPGVTRASIPVNGPSRDVVAVVFPCVGMLNPEWLRPWLHEGTVSSVVLLTCPADDCMFREGPYWLAQNLRYRRAILKEPVYWLEAAAGDGKAWQRLLADVDAAQADYARAAKWVTWVTDKARLWWPRGWRAALASVVALLLLTGASVIVHSPAMVHSPPAAVRIVMVHPGKLKAVQGTLSEEMAKRLPPGLTEAQVLGGERYPVRLRVEVDGQRLWEKAYQPGGIRREGSVYAVETLPLEPGNHQVRLLMMDDGQTWRPVFTGSLVVTKGRVTVLVYDEERGTFTVWGSPATRR